MKSVTERPFAGVAHQIPRNSLALLMVSQWVVIAPLLVHISPWIVAVSLVCGYWRVGVYQGRWGYPSGFIKSLLVIAAIAGIVLTGYSAFSLEAATSLLVLAFTLKLLEMKNRRDAYLVIYLSFFLIATAFLFDQSMPLAAYALFAAMVVTAAMVGMNQMLARVRPLASFKISVALVLQAVPLTVVLFLFFPRAAPLWSIPMPSAATTGISDQITPGDVATLSQSDELAFRAVFDDAVPAQRELYWRGLVYSNFNNGTWTLAEPLAPLLIAPPAADAAGSRPLIGYEMFLQPTQSKWLFALDTPQQFGPRMHLLGDYRLVNAEPVLSVLRYRVASDSRLPMDIALTDAVYRRETALPETDNPRIRAYAQRLYARTGSAPAMVDAMLREIAMGAFSYTLRPPILPRTNSIDAFWFDTRRGFCSHYAGAVVFALRSVGIPARLVGGYQGGEVNPVTGHVVVRQYQAHAWLEAWVEGQGWTRYDPTAAVAPARVETGLNAALSLEDRAILSFLAQARFSGENLLGLTLRFLDTLEHRWNLWVVGYDAATQFDLLERLLGKVTPGRVGLVLLLGGGLSLSLVAVTLFFRRRTVRGHPAEAELRRFAGKMARHGYTWPHGEAPADYLRRLAQYVQYDAEEMVARMQRALYDPAALNDAENVRMLRQDLRKLRFRLAISGVAQRI